MLNILLGGIGTFLLGQRNVPRCPKCGMKNSPVLVTVNTDSIEDFLKEKETISRCPRCGYKLHGPLVLCNSDLKNRVLMYGYKFAKEANALQDKILK